MKRYLVSLLAVAILPLSVFGEVKVLNRLDLANHNDLTTASSTRNYQLGERVDVFDTDKKALKTYVYVRAKGAFAANTIGVVNFSVASSSEVVLAPIPSGTVDYEAGVTPCAFTNNDYGFVQVFGDCSVIPSTNTTLGNTARLLQTSSGAGSYAGDSGAVTVSSPTFGIWNETTYGGGTAADIFLIGRRAYGW